MEGMTGYVMPLEPPAVGWDIHCHTAFSDGTETPATLAEQSKALGLKGVAISDHDTTAGLSLIHILRGCAMTRFNTQLVHGLPVGDNNTGAVNPPIYNSTTYAFEKVDAMPRYD